MNQATPTTFKIKLMEYKGKLYGKIGRRYIPLILTSEEVDAMAEQIKQLQEKLAGANNDQFEVSTYSNDGEVFASVHHIPTGNGADFYSGGEEIGWQDNNSLLCNCDEQTISDARKAAALALR